MPFRQNFVNDIVSIIFKPKLFGNEFLCKSFCGWYFVKDLIAAIYSQLQVFKKFAIFKKNGAVLFCKILRSWFLFGATTLTLMTFSVTKN
jgi:hypothetical protein